MGHPLPGQQDSVVIYMYLISNFVKIVLNTFPFFFSLNLIFKISHLYLCSFAFWRSCCWLFWRTHSTNANTYRCGSTLEPFVLFHSDSLGISKTFSLDVVLSERLSVIKLSVVLLSAFVWNLPNTGSDSPPARSVNAWKTSIYVVFCQHRGALCHVRDH